MKILLSSLAALALLGACRERRADETGSAYRQSSDTVVTKRQVEDTAVVRRDTVVHTDTVKKHGTRPVKTDTVRKH